MNLTKAQKAILQELLARTNERRAGKGKKPITSAQLPQVPRDLPECYLVDTYQVRRHWRRKPKRR